MTDDLYIGLMSGTSLDGIDAVLSRFKHHHPEVLEVHYLPLTTELRDKIKALVQPGQNEINRLTALDVELGYYFAEAANQLLAKSGLGKEMIRAIGSHGQTIRHFPATEFPTTLQIADPNIIAEKTGITTVADFRRRDMAAGGQGAPLVPAFHAEVFRSKDCNRVILNLGGIANITILAADPQIPVKGFDTGPASTLINHWIQQQQSKPFDDKGTWAQSGTVNSEFLSCLLVDDYFRQPPPKSTGTEYFTPAWLAARLSGFPFLAAEDVQATLCEFTAVSIANDINNYALDTEEVYVCGGGVHNDYLLQRIQLHLQGLPVLSTANLGIDPDYVEAITFAWLAKQRLEHKPGNLPDVTGAKRAVISGGVYYS